MSRALSHVTDIYIDRGILLCYKRQFSSVQSLSHVRPFETPWTAARQASLCFAISRACSNSCPLSRLCHPTISSSVVLFSSRLQSFPALGSSPRNQFFASGDQSIGVLCYKVLCYKHKYTYNFILNQQPIKKCIPLCKAIRHMIPFPFTWNKRWTMNHTRTSERNQTQEEARSHLARLPWWLRW